MGLRQLTSSVDPMTQFPSWSYIFILVCVYFGEGGHNLSNLFIQATAITVFVTIYAIIMESCQLPRFQYCLTISSPFICEAQVLFSSNLILTQSSALRYR